MSNALLLPVFVQVALTFSLVFILATARARADKEDPGVIKRSAVDRNVYPDAALKVSNSFDNQFQLPVLFYAVVAFSILTVQESILMIALAWVFVLSRIIHAFIHVGPNPVMVRFIFFGVGLFSLMAMWGALAWHLFRPLS